MKIDDSTQEKMHKMANAYANERIDNVIDTVEERMKNSSGSIIYSRDQIKKELGRYLAISYVKGYADCFERKEQEKQKSSLFQ